MNNSKSSSPSSSENKIKEDIKNISKDELVKTPFECVQPDLNNSLIENFENIEKIIEIIINTSSEDLFREVKTLILNEFDKTLLEIQNYLKKSKNEKNSKTFSYITQVTLYILSILSIKIDIYSLTINGLVERMNKLLMDFIEKSSNVFINKEEKNKIFSSSINILNKFIKLKKHFIREFCQNNKPELQYVETHLPHSVVDNNIKRFKFSFNKFNSFGRYLFNNSLILMNINVNNTKNVNSNPFMLNPNLIISTENKNNNKNYYEYKKKIRNKLCVMSIYSHVERINFQEKENYNNLNVKFNLNKKI